MQNKNENILVSVIMAFWNGDSDEFVKIAVESILAQTHKNLELIISVGGNISAEKDIMLKNFAEKDSRVKVLLSEINTGPSYSRNQGIKIAKGEFCAIADSDDVFLADKIEKQLNYIIERKLDILGCGYIEFRSNHETEKGKARILPPTNREIIKSLPFANPLANSALFIKTAVLKVFLYDENFRPGEGEDYDLIVRLIKAEKTAENLPEPLFFYRLGDNFEKKHANLNCGIKDLQHKFKAASILPFYCFPVVVFVAVLAFASRLFPPKIFNFLRDLRHRIF
jgi:glycosyltransferase involved in cell wall biosynthesis